MKAALDIIFFLVEQTAAVEREGVDFSRISTDRAKEKKNEDISLWVREDMKRGMEGLVFFYKKRATISLFSLLGEES